MCGSAAWLYDGDPVLGLSGPLLLLGRGLDSEGLQGMVFGM